MVKARVNATEAHVSLSVCPKSHSLFSQTLFSSSKSRALVFNDRERGEMPGLSFTTQQINGLREFGLAQYKKPQNLSISRLLCFFVLGIIPPSENGILGHRRPYPSY